MIDAISVPNRKLMQTRKMTDTLEQMPPPAGISYRAKCKK
jgi:hypothetical protein